MSPRISGQPVTTERRKRKSGIPTGNAGEYFVMGELLRRGFDAQLADRNTKGYDVLVGRSEDPILHKVQVKSARTPPWYVRLDAFDGELRERTTIYVLLGAENRNGPVRYFIVKNAAVAKGVHRPSTWKDNGLMPLKALKQYESHWDTVDPRGLKGK